MDELETERLVLRRWRDSDREPFAALNADPEVRRYFPDLLTREQSDASVDRIEAAFERDGFGLWALEVRDRGEFIGFTGLAPVDFEAHFTPAVEIGWRLARDAWGNGYATEAALRVVDDAFGRLGFDEIVSFTAIDNAPSRAVMERIGMSHDPAEDFDHPKLPLDHPLCRHVLYRLRAPG